VDKDDPIGTTARSRAVSSPICLGRHMLIGAGLATAGVALIPSTATASSFGSPAAGSSPGNSGRVRLSHSGGFNQGAATNLDVLHVGAGGLSRPAEERRTRAGMRHGRADGDPASGTAGSPTSTSTGIKPPCWSRWGCWTRQACP
jgi:hypothetical protein